MKAKPEPEYTYCTKCEIDMYPKDNTSKEAITKPLKNGTHLKIHIAGHCSPGGNTLTELENHEFDIDYRVLTQLLDTLFKRLFLENRGIAQDVEFACYAGAGDEESNDYKTSFSYKLLKELQKKGYKGITIKSYPKPRVAPVPHLPKIFTKNTKSIFATTSDGGVAWNYDAKQCWPYQIKKRLRKLLKNRATGDQETLARVYELFRESFPYQAATHKIIDQLLTERKEKLQETTYYQTLDKRIHKIETTLNTLLDTFQKTNLESLTDTNEQESCNVSISQTSIAMEQ